jgi:uncharacterized damage-inducible protein DinB
MPDAPAPDILARNPIALLFPELDAEIAATRAMLAIVPWEQAAWKPHPKSMSLGQLATHVAQLPNFSTVMASTDTMDFKPEHFQQPAIASTTELLAMFDSEVEKMRAAFSPLDWARMQGSWTMTMQGHTIVDGERAMLIRHMGINHIVHHRAQLGVFLRLLDVKIPGSYGPSADTM